MVPSTACHWILRNFIMLGNSFPFRQKKIIKNYLKETDFSEPGDSMNSDHEDVMLSDFKVKWRKNKKKHNYRT